MSEHPPATPAGKAPPPTPRSWVGYIESKLRRTTSTGRYIPFIDGLRFLAIAWVVLLHIHCYIMDGMSPHHPAPINLLGMVFNWGNAGVQLFFAISGFIIGMPFIESRLQNLPPVSLKEYFLRRLTRLEPPYIVILCLCLAMLVVVKHESLGALLPHFAASFFYLHNIIFVAPSTINSVSWSLEIEAQFYILAPLFLAGIFRFPPARRRLLMVGLIVLFGSGAVTEAIKPVFARPDLTLLGQFQYFLVGFLLADYYQTCPAEKEGRRLFWDAAGWLTFLLLPFVYASKTWGSMAFPLAILTLYLSVIYGITLRRVFTNPILCVIGGMCYTIYLIHVPILSALFRLTRHFYGGDNYYISFAVQSLAVIPVVLFISVLLFLVLEKPCMNKKWPWQLAAWVRSKLPQKP